MKKSLTFLSSLSVLLLISASVFAQGEAEAPAARQGSFMQTIIMIAVALVFFYFILWRPEQKRRKAMEKQRSSMKKGDRVTAMGIIGTIDKIKDTTVIVKMVDGAKLEILKAAITDVQSGLEEESKKVEATVESSETR
jgi:preprotein translocase subunit YajC